MRCSTAWRTSPTASAAATWTGHTGQAIRNVVNIGIGGSDLGPVMAYEALRHFSDRRLTFRFVSNIDGTDFAEAVRDLDPAETLFIVSSKTFTTLETMTNARTARAWSLAGVGGDERRLPSTSSPSRPMPRRSPTFGIDTANMFGFWDWVGGRYSMDSAIGLSTMLAIGPEASATCSMASMRWTSTSAPRPSPHNLPVLMGLVGIWNTNFLGAHTIAILPYEQYLKRFPAYLQQLTMESNGKRVTLDGAEVDYETSPVYWGEPGTNGQHSFYQLIHQGTRLIPCDFIAFGEPLNPLGTHHDILMANVFAQGEALAFGKTPAEVRAEGSPEWLIPHRTFPGNRPSNTLLLPRLTPSALGQARRALRAHRLHAGCDLEPWLLRPVGRGAREGAGAANHARARRGRGVHAHSRQFDQYLDPALSDAQGRSPDKEFVMYLGMIGLSTSHEVIA